MTSLAERFRDTRDWPYLVDLAIIYDRGWYPEYRSNRDLATLLYDMGTKSPDPVVSRHCMIWMLTQLDLPHEDNAGSPLPNIPAYTVLEMAQRMHHERMPTSLPQKIEQAPPTEPITPPKPLIQSDPQNVHDHGVTRSLKRILHTLETPRQNPDDTVTDVRAYILDSDASADLKQQALETLDSLTDTRHSTLETTEKDVLRTIWDACTTNDMKNILVSQLASAVERDAVVCSTGKIGRMVGTLDGVREDTSIRPVWAIREEIGRLASSMRDAGKTPDDFKAACLQTYVKDLEMNQDLISNIVDEYAPYIE